jgi:branched-chain amino acid transport system substrate-binding protein
MRLTMKRLLPVLLLATTTLTSAQSVVRIGTPLALTGGLSYEGKKQQVAYDIWLKRVNADGGIRVGDKKVKVEMVSYDYQSDDKRAQQMAEKLITQDKVDFMTAPFGSGHTKVVASVAERYGVPVIAVASSEAVHNQGYTNLFGTLAPSVGLVDAMIAHFKEKNPGMQKVATLGRDDVFPGSMANSLAAQAPAAGLRVVFNSLYPVGSFDRGAPLTAIKAAQPDWIFVTGYTNDLILVRKQMADLGVKAPVITMITGPAYQEFIDALGPLGDALLSINRTGLTILLVEQDVLTAFDLAQHAFVVETSKVSLSGGTAQLATDPRIRQAYMGI